MSSLGSSRMASLVVLLACATCTRAFGVSVYGPATLGLNASEVAPTEAALRATFPLRGLRFVVSSGASRSSREVDPARNSTVEEVGEIGILNNGTVEDVGELELERNGAVEEVGQIGLLKNGTVEQVGQIGILPNGSEEMARYVSDGQLPSGFVRQRSPHEAVQSKCVDALHCPYCEPLAKTREHVAPIAPAPSTDVHSKSKQVKLSESTGRTRGHVTGVGKSSCCTTEATTACTTTTACTQRTECTTACTTAACTTACTTAACTTACTTTACTTACAGRSKTHNSLDQARGFRDKLISIMRNKKLFLEDKALAGNMPSPMLAPTSNLAPSSNLAPAGNLAPINSAPTKAPAGNLAPTVLVPTNLAHAAVKTPARSAVRAKAPAGHVAPKAGTSYPAEVAEQSPVDAPPVNIAPFDPSFPSD